MTVYRVEVVARVTRVFEVQAESETEALATVDDMVDESGDSALLACVEETWSSPYGEMTVTRIE